MDAIDPTVRTQIEHLVCEHNWLTDHGHADKLWELFTPDAVTEGPMGTMVGQDGIREWGARRVRVTAGIVRHVFGGLRLAWVDGVLTGTTYYLAYRDSSPNPLVPASMGEFQDEYAQVDGQWRIRHRVIKPIFGAENAAAHAQRVAQAEPGAA